VWDVRNVQWTGLDWKRNTVVVVEEDEDDEVEEGAFSVTMIVSGLGVTTLVTTWGGAGADYHTMSNTDGVRVRAGDNGGLRKKRRGAEIQGDGGRDIGIRILTVGACEVLAWV